MFNIKVLVPKKNIIIFCNYVGVQETLSKPPNTSTTIQKERKKGSITCIDIKS